MNLSKIILVFGLLFLLVGCISTASEPDIVATRLLPSAVPIIPPQEYDLVAGASLFTESCAPCHGSVGLGDGPAASGFTCPMPKLAQRPSGATLVEWYDIAYNGLRTSDTCIMPPWSGRLSEAEVWNVTAYAYSLKFGAGDTAQGEALLTTLPSQLDPARLADGAWQAETSDTTLLRLATNNFATDITLQDQADLFAYLRSQVYVNGTIPSVAAPVATEEAEPETPVATEEALTATDSTPAPIPTTPITINGQLMMGTADGNLPTEALITLRVVGLDEQGQPQEVYNAQTSPNPDGAFQFADVPRQARTLGIAQIDYAGLRQFSDQFFPSTVEGDTLALPFTIYETTDDPSAIQLSYVEFLIDAITSEAASLTYQTHEVSNTGDRIYTGQNGITAIFPLPAGVINPEVIESGGVETGRFRLELADDHYVVYDSQPIVPNQPESITVAYNYPYEGSMTISPTFNYPVNELNVFVSTDHDLQVESTQLSRTVPATLNEITYQGYALAASPLAAQQTLNFRVFDGQPVFISEASTQQDEGFLQKNTTLILGLGVLLIVAGGIFLAYDLQKTRLLTNAANTTAAPLQDRQSIIAQIAALDDAYEDGQLKELDYQQQRGRLKAQLAQIDPE